MYMETLVKADIFFFVATICLIIITAILAVGCYYLVQVLNKLNRISTKVQEESDNFINDVAAVRKTFVNTAQNVASARTASVVANSVRSFFTQGSEVEYEEVQEDEDFLSMLKNKVTGKKPATKRRVVRKQKDE